MSRKVNLLLKRVLDVFLAVPVIPAAFLLRFLRIKRIECFPLCRIMLDRIGVFPIRDHYYEPLINPGRLRMPLSSDRYLPGIDWNTGEQIELLRSLRFGEELEALKRKEKGPGVFDFDNESFRSGDYEVWYSIIRSRKPRRILEIGCGNSTMIALEAIKKNKTEDPEYLCEQRCIEPFEWPMLEQLGVHVVRQRVEEMDLDMFRTLRDGDILFIDSSHMIRPQGDVLFEILEILPILEKGVLVHVHDIFSPKDYLEQWVVRDMRFWNEQYILEAFLTCNNEWKIVAALNYLHHHHYDELKAACRFLTPDREPGSFYIEKR